MIDLVLAVSLVPAATAAERPCALDLVGTWQLASISNQTPDGKRNEAPFGKHPSGMLIYAPDGHMSVIISYDERKRLSSEDRLAPSMEEKANAFDSSFGYSGRYTCSGDRVIHHVTTATVPNWVGTDMLRIIKSADGSLSLSTPPLPLGGTASTWELIWERPK